MKTLKTRVFKNLTIERFFLAWVAVAFAAAGLLACQNLLPHADTISSSDIMKGSSRSSLPTCSGTSSLNGDYVIQFDLVNNMTSKTPIRCQKGGSTFSLNGTSVSPTDLRFFVSDIVLVQADNTECSVPIVADGQYQYSNALLLDFEQKKIDGGFTGCSGDNTVNFGLKSISGNSISIPTGIKALKFTLGLQPLQNNLNGSISQPSPMNKNGLYWTWTDGYKFTKIEVTTTDESEILTELHVGSTGCTTYDSSNPSSTGVPTCSKPFRSEITISAPSGGSFDFGTQKVYLSMDALFNGYNLSSQVPGGCMPGEGKTSCIPVLGHLGLDTDGLSTGTQSAFFIQ